MVPRHAWQRKFVLTLAVGTAVLLLAGMLSRGTARGDEAVPVLFAGLWWRGDWPGILHALQDPWTVHRIFWCVEKVVWGGLFAGLDGYPRLHDALMTMDGVLFMLAAVGIATWHLAGRGYGLALGSLATATIFLASSGISFFAGGQLECQMCLYAVLIVAAIDRSGPMTRRRWLLLLTATGALIFCKAYSVACLLPLSLLLKGRQERLTYAVCVLAILAAWAALMFGLGSQTQAGGMGDFYGRLLVDFGPRAVTIRLGEFLFSWPFGLLWSFPLLFLCCAAICCRNALIAKAAGVMLIGCVLCFFGFWSGEGAMAGQRYIVPYLAILLPEAACGLSVLLHRRRWIGFLVPLLAMFFLPCIEYRNSLMYAWDGHAAPQEWAFGDPHLHPGVFAWRVLAAKELGAPNFRPSPQLPLTVDTGAIFPMTGVSRVIYLLQGHVDPADPRRAPVLARLHRSGLDHVLFWKVLRLLLVAAFLVWLLRAARHAAPIWKRPIASDEKVPAVGF